MRFKSSYAKELILESGFCNMAPAMLLTMVPTALAVKKIPRSFVILSLLQIIRIPKIRATAARIGLP